MFNIIFILFMSILYLYFFFKLYYPFINISEFFNYFLDMKNILLQKLNFKISFLETNINNKEQQFNSDNIQNYSDSSYKKEKILSIVSCVVIFVCIYIFFKNNIPSPIETTITQVIENIDNSPDNAPQVNPTEVVNAPQIVDPTEVVNAPQIVNPTEVVNAPQIVNPTEVVNAPQVNPTEVVNAPQVNPIIEIQPIVQNQTFFDSFEYVKRAIDACWNDEDPSFKKQILKTDFQNPYIYSKVLHLISLEVSWNISRDCGFVFNQALLNEGAKIVAALNWEINDYLLALKKKGE